MIQLYDRPNLHIGLHQVDAFLGHSSRDVGNSVSHFIARVSGVAFDVIQVDRPFVF